MAGQIVVMAEERDIGRQRFHGRGRARVQRAAHIGGRRVVHDVAHEPARERELARRVVPEQARALGIVHGRFDLGPRQHRAQQIELRLDPEHGRRLEHVAGGLLLQRQPGRDEIGQRGRRVLGLAPLEDVAHDVVDVTRVRPRGLEQRLHGRHAHDPLILQAIDERAQVRRIERADLEARHRARPLRSERGGRRHHDRRQREVGDLGGAPQDLEARVIEPVDVLAHDGDRPLAPGTLERSQCGPHHLAPADRRLELEQRGGVTEELGDAGDIALVEADPEDGCPELVLGGDGRQLEHGREQRADGIERRGQAARVRTDLIDDPRRRIARDQLVRPAQQRAATRALEAHHEQTGVRGAGGMGLRGPPHVREQRDQLLLASDEVQRHQLGGDRGRRRDDLERLADAATRRAALGTELERGRAGRAALEALVALGGRARAQRQHAECRAHVRRRREAVARVLGQRLGNDRVEILADGGAPRRQRWDHRLEVVGEDLRRGAREERRLVREQLVQDDPDGVDVRGERRLRAADHLGCHVLRRAGDRPVVGVGAIAGHQARDAEVDDLHDIDACAPLIENDVVGLQIGVHHAREVRLLDAGERLHDDVDHALDGERVLGDEELRQGRALDVLHREIQQPVRCLPVVDDRDAVRVVQPRRGHRLVAKPLDHPPVHGQLLVQELHGDGPAERHLVGAIHRATAADADAGREAILVAEHAADKLQRLCDLFLNWIRHGKTLSPTLGGSDPPLGRLSHN